MRVRRASTRAAILLKEFLQDRASSSPSRSLAATVACHGVRWRPRHVTGEHIADHLAWHLTSAGMRGRVYAA